MHSGNLYRNESVTSQHLAEDAPFHPNSLASVSGSGNVA